MPFCPVCRYEYNPGVFECPDCREKLVDLLEPEPSQAGPDFLQTGREMIRFIPMPDLSGSIYSEMVKGALEERGIQCYIGSDGIYRGFMGVGTPLIPKGYRIFVPEDRYEECLEIQRQMMDGG
jgi:hypothetical protein